MGNLFAILLAGFVVSTAAQARDSDIKFDGVQENCVKAGNIKFGAASRWSECTVTKGRWFATLDFMDMYQAQYCLGKGGGECEQRALLVFSNRAYTPLAKLMLTRIDSGQAQYEDPLLVQTKFGNILTLRANLPDGSSSMSYYRWQKGRWMPLEARSWLADLSRQLPKGAKIKGTNWPDADSMSAQVALGNTSGDAANGKLAEVRLALVKDRFTIEKLTLVPTVD
ncbi:MAG: hypothetical protein WCJ76_01795 [Comamonadaceae bacterium]